ncbi:PKD domain-containing protein [uncultured Chitinophaga sp.]|uniref:PKD domain-containing protein n=1 Tax=uncultured Chitinophaga sp. TaxID=339340 RepID=UPI00261A4997|nr:PKD domain-containing protein [uncultured Chitinophaga sp.]
MRRSTFLVSILLCHILPAVAQTHHVDFDADRWNGCEPLAVQFTNLSDPGYSTVNWSFSVGADVSDPNPGRIFNNAGVYKITLTVTYPDGAVVTREKDVTVYRKPIPAFSTSVPGGCTPLAVTFTDQSAPGDGSITSITWDFGDGTNGTGPTATHTYTLSGNQTTSVIVVNSHGCTNGTTRQINIQEPPVVRFAADVRSSCTAPLTVNFSNTSTSPNGSAMTYLWDFGDGATSTDATPQHTYTTEGQFTVRLTATAAGGCSQTLTETNYIQIVRMVPDFAAVGNVCVNQPLTLENRTTPAPQTARWDFPDGSTQYGVNITHTFTQPGDYPITMTATGTGGCQETITRTIRVNPLPTADFTGTPAISCRVPTIVNFNAQTTGATTWTWNFGDGATGSGQTVSHSYAAQGNYTVSLQASNAAGCSVNITKPDYIQIQEPTVTFFVDTPRGCVPFSSNFIPTVVSIDPVVGYNWNFGDGTTSNLERPSHTWTTQGDFTVTLEIVTQSGCTATATAVIEAGFRSVVDFEVDKTRGCQPDIFHFINRSVPPGDEWLWQFPQDGSTETAENPAHQFNQIGQHDVILTVFNNGCPSTLVKPMLIEIYPPVARFTVLPDCVNKYDRQFNDQSDFGASVSRSWLWDFGDGNTSTLQSPLHTYAAAGTYTVRLTVDNGSCTSTTTQQVLIIDEKVAIAPTAPAVCAGNAIGFTITNADTIHNNLIRFYRWDFGDGTVQTIDAADFDPDAVYNHTYNTPGNFNVVVTIEDLNGCQTVSNTVAVTINGITANFTFTGNCRETPFTFTDASVPAFPTTVITSWIWNFGDGSQPDTLTTQPVGYPHTFPNMTGYPVRLTVTDQFGCTSSVTRNVNVNVVNASIVVPQQEACLQKAFGFSNNSIGNNLTFDWSFGDGGVSTEAAPQHTYTAPGVYTIKLTVTDSDGCMASQEALHFITVRNPQAAFTVPDDIAPCPPVLVPFTNGSSDYDEVAWQFGDGSTSPLESPSHAYSRPGTYTVTLTVSTAGGCAVDTTMDIFIDGPDGRQSATPTKGCMPLHISMSATSTNAVKYIWDFDDGHLVTTTTPTTDYTYPKEGIYYPRVILEDAKGCQVPALGNDTIVADKVTARFTMDNAAACDSGFIYFMDNSSSVTLDQLGEAMTYQWDFGVPGRTDDIATGRNPRFFYTQTGVYQVHLLVTSSLGCTDTITLPAVVSPQPEAEILPLTPLCAGGEVQLQGRERKQLAGTQWHWRVGQDLYDVTTPPALTFETPGDIPVVLTISNGDGTCPDTAGSTIQVRPYPLLDPTPKQAVVCEGSPLQLQANVDAGTQVTWTDYNISDPRSTTPEITPDRDTTYHVIAQNAFGCMREADISITVSRRFEVNTTDVSICHGNKVQLNAGGAVTYRWIPETGLNRADINNPIAGPENTTTYQVIGYGNDACFTDTAIAVVTVHPSPEINVGPDLVVATGSEVRLQPVLSTDVTSIQWRPAEGLSCIDCETPLVLPRSNINYFATVTNQYGCTATDGLNIRLVCESSSIFLPNTFTPNGDGQNDIFYIRGRGVRNVKVFRIFNRWGQLVFERSNLSTDDPTSGWDGKFQGIPVNPDVFIYYAELVCDSNETFTMKGNVTVLR